MKVRYLVGRAIINSLDKKAHWKEYLTQDATEWLLNSNPWTRYRTLVDLCDLPETDERVIEARKALVKDAKIIELIEDATQWFPEMPKRHDDSKMSHYKLRMLSDFGLTHQDEGIATIITKAQDNMDKELYSIRQALPTKKPENDLEFESWNALPCDSPLITYTLLALGDTSDKTLKSAEFFTKSWEKEDGWFCDLFFVKGQHKKYGVGCPMSGLFSMEIFDELNQDMLKEHVQHAYYPLKFHKELGKSLYYFGRSKKFFTMKYPFVWYNALYIGEVLSKVKVFNDLEVMKEIIQWIIDSQDEEGKFKATSMFREYKGWDFADKKTPSPWITFLAYRILKRWHLATTAI